MRNKQFAAYLRKIKDLLEATDEQMAKHLRMSVESYRALESGAKTLTLTARKRINKRIEQLLKICGIEL